MLSLLAVHLLPIILSVAASIAGAMSLTVYTRGYAAMLAESNMFSVDELAEHERAYSERSANAKVFIVLAITTLVFSIVITLGDSELRVITDRKVVGSLYRSIVSLTVLWKFVNQILAQRFIIRIEREKARLLVMKDLSSLLPENRKKVGR